MGNGRKQTALWLVFVEGAALSLGIYLLLTVLLSALVVKAVLPEEGSFPAVAASCCLASFAGAMLSVRRSSWGSLASAMVSAAGFLLAVVAVALWQRFIFLMEIATNSHYRNFQHSRCVFQNLLKRCKGTNHF